MARPVQEEEETIGVGAPLRQARGNEWLRRAEAPLIAQAVAKRRQEERALGPVLLPHELRALVDEHNELQRRINPLQDRQERIAARLRAHWGHTGATALEGSSGTTQISTSAELCFVSGPVEKTVSERVWRAISARSLHAAKAAAFASTRPSLRSTLVQALRVRTLRVAITPPASREAKSPGESSAPAKTPP